VHPGDLAAMAESFGRSRRAPLKVGIRCCRAGKVLLPNTLIPLDQPARLAPRPAPGWWRWRSRQAGKLGDQAKLACPGDSLGAVGRAELAKDVADVLFDRIEADHQLLGDARVRRARGQQHQDLQLPGG
jgi:hypothetical protein